MIRRVQAAAVVVAGAALLAACGAGSSGHSPATITRTVTQHSASPTSSTTPPATSTTSTATSATPADVHCVAADLALSSIGGSAATGHELLAFGLRNTSSHPCATGGYPGVLFLDAAGKGLPTTPDHTTQDFFGHTSLRALTVAPGQLVSFRIGVTDVGSGGGSGGCVAAKGVQVIAPDDTATMRITRDVYECGGTVSVSPLQAGTAARG